VRGRIGVTIPGARGALYFAILGSVLVEYSLWPMGAPGFDYGGLWSLVGNLLLVATVGLLVWYVARPLLSLLRRHLPSRSGRAGFLLLWGGSTLTWMWLTSEIGVQSVGSGPISTGVTMAPVLGPFGMLPSLEFLVSPGGFEGYLSPLLALVLLLSLASSGLLALRLFAGVESAACTRQAPLRRPSSFALASWIPPLGLTLSCCSTPVLGLAAILATGSAGLSVALGASAPLANGLLLVAALGLLLAGLHSATKTGGPPGRTRSSRPTLEAMDGC
jgi:hypothetical protein